jgi:hypothetical protein
MRITTMNRTRRRTISRPLQSQGLVIAVPLSLLAALTLSACENTASYTQLAAARVIDASYIAPASNFAVEGQLIAANIGSGTISAYGTLAPNPAASIEMTATSGGAALLNASSPLVAGNQYSIFVSDSSGTQTAYVMTVLQDQQTPAPTGRADFRFINQASLTGAVDIYMVPAGTAIANAVPLVAALPVGVPLSYVSFTAQPVTMIVTPTGVTTPAFVSNTIPLIGGEARTVLIMDSKLTSNPPVTVIMADDAGPAN